MRSEGWIKFFFHYNVDQITYLYHFHTFLEKVLKFLCSKFVTLAQSKCILYKEVFKYLNLKNFISAPKICNQEQTYKELTLITGYHDKDKASYSKLVDLTRNKIYTCDIPKVYGSYLFHLNSMYYRDGIYQCTDYYHNNRGCWIMKRNSNNTWITKTNIFPDVNQRRAASIFVPNHGWWFVGGDLDARTTKIMNLDNYSLTKGPNVPLLKALTLTCAVQFNETISVFMGGQSNYGTMDTTWTYDWHKQKLSQMSYKLNYKRTHHVCGLYKYSKVVMFGGSSTTTEMLEIEDSSPKWIVTGTSIANHHPKMVELNGDLYMCPNSDKKMSFVYKFDGTKWIKRSMNFNFRVESMLNIPSTFFSKCIN